MHISQRYYNVIITLLESITIICPFHNVMITLCVCWVGSVAPNPLPFEASVSWRSVLSYLSTDRSQALWKQQWRSSLLNQCQVLVLGEISHRGFLATHLKVSIGNLVLVTRLLSFECHRSECHEMLNQLGF